MTYDLALAALATASSDLVNYGPTPKRLAGFYQAMRDWSAWEIGGVADANWTKSEQDAKTAIKLGLDVLLAA